MRGLRCSRRSRSPFSVLTCVCATRNQSGASAEMFFEPSVSTLPSPSTSTVPDATWCCWWRSPVEKIDGPNDAGATSPGLGAATRMPAPMWLSVSLCACASLYTAVNSSPRSRSAATVIAEFMPEYVSAPANFIVFRTGSAPGIGSTGTVCDAISPSAFCASRALRCGADDDEACTFWFSPDFCSVAPLRS